MLKKASEILLPILFLSGFIYWQYYLKEHSPNAQDAKLKELKSISKEIPVYPDFTKTGQQESSRAIDAGIYQYFLSRTNFESVKKFYTQNLTQIGWTQVENNDDSLVFQKDDFYLHIEYRMTANNWNYGLSYV